MAKKIQAILDIEKCWKQILEGKILCIDPSSGSHSSMPGYALYDNCELKESGIIEIDSINETLPIRLRELAVCLQNDFGRYDVLVIEAIPPIHGGGRRFNSHAKTHASLLKSCGTILGAVDRAHTVSLHPRTWQKWKDDNYVKSDQADAEYIGVAAIAMAKKEKERLEKAAKKKEKANG